ncbi:hypothetical protein [Enterococcus xiangfangensis]|uniref:hypothetical protein n=1 Tax=Enterococcus xiangfangensis TaxID=1296537 RepID=UPI003D16FD73|nr:hypothetical protein [Enterococcus asini]
MLTKQIAVEMKDALKFELDGNWELYSEKENNDLDQAIDSMKFHSYAGSRDGDYIVLTKNGLYEREVLELDDSSKVYGTNLYGEWLIQDAGEDNYSLALVADSVDLDEEVEG